MTNVELVEQEDNPSRELCRYEFLEILVRIAGAKYKDSFKAKSWDEALSMLLEINIKPNLQNYLGGQSFRDKYIW